MNKALKYRLYPTKTQKINVNTFTTTYGVERARTRGPIYNKNVAKAVQNTAKVKGGMKMAM